MAERVTIIVEPNMEHGDVLTVQDAMLQVLDFIEVVVAAASDDARPKVGWKLVSATTNSPYTVVAEAFSFDPEWVADESAREAKARAGAALNGALSGELPTWLDEKSTESVRRIYSRNLNGIGRTTIQFDGESSPLIIAERNARSALGQIQRVEAELRALVPDYSGVELGSIDGHVVDATTHYGNPALRIRDRLTGERIVCVIPQEIADEVGKDHDWRDVWSGERVRVSGRIKRNVSGAVTTITAESVTRIEPKKTALVDVTDSGFTGGKGAREYLDEIWDGPIGEK